MVMEGRGTVSSHWPSLSHGWSTTVSREERCCASTTSMVLSRLGKEGEREGKGKRGEGGKREGKRERERKEV